MFDLVHGLSSDRRGVSRCECRKEARKEVRDGIHAIVDAELTPADPGCV